MFRRRNEHAGLDALAAEAAEDREWVARERLPGDSAAWLDMDDCLRRGRSFESLGERVGVVLVVRSHNQVLPATHNRLALPIQLCGERRRSTMRRKFNPHLPLSQTRLLGLGGLLFFKLLVLSPSGRRRCEIG